MGRLLAAEGGHLVAALAMAGVAAGVLSAVAYAIVLLLPAQSWVLNAADSYAHFLTLPVGLWTLAALIELAPAIAADGRAGPRRRPDADAKDEAGRQHPIAPRCPPARRCAGVLTAGAAVLMAIGAAQSTTLGIGSPAAIPSGNSLR